MSDAKKEKPTDLPEDPSHVDAEETMSEASTIIRTDADEKTQRLAHHAQHDATLPPDKTNFDGREKEASQSETRLRYFGNYELLDEIARGGMGVVYRAKQIGLNRTVAIKMILSGQLAGNEDVKRFRVEAEAAAQLDHPGIVPIYEVGECDGQHYFSMAFIEGQSLADKIAGGPLPPREAAEMIARICDAISNAHKSGVVHRDLKPANIMLDQAEQPRVTDFGLAKRMETDSKITGTGQILGTPSYMAPEQINGKTDEVGPLADIYALGAILFNLLTGRPPFQEANVMDTLMQVLEREPVPPRQLNPTVPVDLETICIKCLNKTPHKRYATADELQAELQRFLSNKTIIARPASISERSWRWCRRNPAVAAMTTLAGLFLVAGAVISTYYAVKADQEAARANGQALRASQEADAARKSKDQAESLAEKAKELTREAEESAKNAQAAADDAKKKELLARKAEQKALQAEKEALRAQKRLEAELRMSTSFRLAAESQLTRELRPQRSLLLAMEAIETTRSHDESVDAKVEQNLREAMKKIGGLPFPMNDKHDRSTRRISRDCRILAFRNNQEITVLDLHAKDPMRTAMVLRGHADYISMIALSSSGKWLASASLDGTARIWNLEESEPKKSVRVLQMDSSELAPRGYANNMKMELSEDGSRLAIAREYLAPHNGHKTECKLQTWDLELDTAAPDNLELTAFSTGTTTWSLSPDGRRLISSNIDINGYYVGDIKSMAMRMWDLKSDALMASEYVLQGDGSRIHEWAISPKGDRVVTFGSKIHFWNLDDLSPDNAPEAEAVLDTPSLSAYAFSPNGRWFVNTGFDGTLQVRDLAAANPDVVVFEVNKIEPYVRIVSVSQNGQHVATASGINARIYDFQSRNPSKTAINLSGHDESIRSLQLSPDGMRLATQSFYRGRTWDLTTDSSPSSLAIPARYTVGIGLRDDTLVTLSNNVKLWDLNDPRRSGSWLRGEAWNAGIGTSRIRTGRNNGTEVTLGGFSEDGSCLVHVTRDKKRIHRTLFDNEPTPDRLRGFKGSVEQTALTPDGKRFAAASDDNNVYVWEFESANPSEVKYVLTGHTEKIGSVEFGDHGKKLMTTSADLSARVWDLESPDPNDSTLIFDEHERRIYGSSFSAHGNRIATMSYYNKLRVWDLTRPKTQMKIAEFRLHNNPYYLTKLSPNGRWLVVANGGGRDLYYWDLTSDLHKRRGNKLEIANVERVLFGSDNSRIFTGSEDGTIGIWNLAAKHPDATSIFLKGHAGAIRSLALSPDGHFLASASYESVRVWPMRIEDLVKSAHRVVGRQLTRDERNQHRIQEQSVR